MIIRPARLEQGDLIAVVSPSWGGAAIFPHRVDRGIRHLESLGYRVKTAPHALNQRGYVSDTAANRARDIQAMFADQEVKAIIAAIGGDHSCHLLPLLDYTEIRQNPKIFMGYSDVTVLNVAIFQQTGLVTFNGPALLTDFGESPSMFGYTEEYFHKAVARGEPIGRVEPSPVWTEEFQDWEAMEDLERPRALSPSPGWTWLKPGRAQGVLMGGCLESLQHLRGTPYWPDWDGAILFVETSEEKPGPETVDAILMDYQNMGVLEKLRGLLVGRPMKYTPEETRQLDEVLLERARAYSFPIVSGMDFGHTAPQFTLPIGIPARIDTEEESFEILEPAVS